MTALAIHPSPSSRRMRERAPGDVCPYTRSGRERRHLSVVPTPATATADTAVPHGGVAKPAVTTVARLRLTTRGRRVFIALGFVLAIILGGGLGAVAYSPDITPGEVDTVTVQPGQSLWVIAEGVAVPGQDVREVVEQIRVLNTLEQSTVHAGQELTVPAG